MKPTRAGPVQPDRGRGQGAPGRADSAGSASRSAGRRFRYSLIDLAGYTVGEVERERALVADELIDLDTRRAERWRVISVLGTSATVVPHRD